MASDTSPWSVRFSLDEEEAGPISRVMGHAFEDDVRLLWIGGTTTDGFDEAPHLTLELEAQDAYAAEGRAQELMTQVRAAADLDEASMPVAWVAPLDKDPTSSHRFLAEARDLLGNEQFEMAVVAAHMHIELQVRTLLRRASESVDARWAERFLKGRGVATLGNDQSRAVVEVMLGVDVTQLPEWSGFRAHLTRRNAVVHEGQAIGEREAAASVEAVQKLWVRLVHAAREAH